MNYMLLVEYLFLWTFPYLTYYFSKKAIIYFQWHLNTTESLIPGTCVLSAAF